MRGLSLISIRIVTLICGPVCFGGNGYLWINGNRDALCSSRQVYIGVVDDSGGLIFLLVAVTGQMPLPAAFIAMISVHGRVQGLSPYGYDHLHGRWNDAGHGPFDQTKEDSP
ncbi:unnamed protein product [Calypogeia fissa]